MIIFVKNGPFVLTHQINGVVVNKQEEDWTQEEREKIQHNLKAKTIITTVLSIDEFFNISHCETTKEMFYTLPITNEGTTEVKRKKTNILAHEYELFIMKPEENIYDMDKRFIHVINHMRNLGKVFQNEDLVVKFLR